jgi:hypothetical protein
MTPMSTLFVLGAREVPPFVGGLTSVMRHGALGDLASTTSDNRPFSEATSGTLAPRVDPVGPGVRQRPRANR